VSVVVELEGQSASGQGVATDIIQAAGMAYVRALTNAQRKARHAASAPPVTARPRELATP
jgi:2-isopropylmalate synthase